MYCWYYSWCSKCKAEFMCYGKLSQNAEIRTHKWFYLTLKLNIHSTHKSNKYIIPIGVWETSIKTKSVASTDATDVVAQMPPI